MNLGGLKRASSTSGGTCEMTSSTESRLCESSLECRGGCSAALKDLASGRIRGRNHYIVFLAKMSKKVTGREHYEKLADEFNGEPL
jgi:hypothetical protein